MSILVTGTPISFEDFCARMDSFNIQESESFWELNNLRVEFAGAEKLRDLDPFSDEYRAAALAIYEGIKGSRGYTPESDEKALETDMSRLFTDTNPWHVKDSKYLSEFLYSWAHITRLLDLKPGGSVLEYGPGSGELLLMLARIGIDAYGVDIEPFWLDAIRKRAEIMGTHVNLDKGAFGEGFDGRRFDRILFFEAFHHAIGFLDLLEKLKERLNPGGYIVFCGEPVMGAYTDSMPYPWGPRLDGLSVWSIRKFGWMELGFTHEFFSQALRRAGYDVCVHAAVECGRAFAYTAKPGAGRMVDAKGNEIVEDASSGKGLGDRLKRLLGAAR